MQLGFIVVVATAIIFGIIGYIYSRGRIKSVEDFISARNSLGVFFCAGTLYASAMGAWILFSPAETTVTAGLMALLGYGLGSAAALWIFMWLGVKIRRIMPQGHTIPEFIFHRYGKSMYSVVLLCTLFYMSVYLIAELTGISLAMQMVFGIPLLYTAAIVAFTTVAYTAFGGIKSTVFTDVLQAVIILPLLLLIFIGGAIFLGGFEPIISKISTVSSDLLLFGNMPGIEFGLTLIIAIVAAELFNQVNWQRAYAAKDDNTVKKSFLYAGFFVFPTIIIAGLIGFFSLATGTADVPSVALFTFLKNAAPSWMLITGMVLGVILVMSTISALLNGLVSVFTTDIVRLKPSISKNKVLIIAKWFTVALGILGTAISAYGFSVLYLFLVADLVCAAAAFPAFYGLFSKKISGIWATIATVVGIVVGTFYFPDPSFSRGNLFLSFVVAFVVPAIISLIAGAFGKAYNFNELKKKVLIFSK